MPKTYVPKGDDGSLKLDLRLMGRIARGEVDLSEIQLTKQQVKAIQLLRSWHNS